MIQIYYPGLGGSYTQYLKQSIKRSARIRQVEITNKQPIKTKNCVVVTVCKGANQLTSSKLSQILESQDVIFILNDSSGKHPQIAESSEYCFSLSQLDIDHQIEAAIITTELERIITH